MTYNIIIKNIYKNIKLLYEAPQEYITGRIQAHGRCGLMKKLMRTNKRLNKK